MRLEVNEFGDFIVAQQPTPEESKILEELLTNLANSNSIARGLAKEIDGELKQGKLSLYVVEKLSRWCDAQNAHARGVTPARNVSKFLFGLILPRLIDKKSKKVSDYYELLALIKKNMNSVSASNVS